MDEILWKYVPAKKGLLGCQRTVTLSGKYAKEKNVAWGKPVIMLQNYDRDPRTTLPQSELEWFLQNVEIVELTQPLNPNIRARHPRNPLASLNV